jgi:hypothetical protein
MCGPRVGNKHFQTSARKSQHTINVPSTLVLTWGSVHKCRDYSKVLQWARVNYVHGRNVADIERVPGALERDTRP